jgi:hypothetical protein
MPRLPVSISVAEEEAAEEAAQEVAGGEGANS